MVLTAGPRTATLRLRLPWLRADDRSVPISIYLGPDPGVIVNGCDILEVSWSWGAGADNGVTTAVDAGSGTIRLLDPERRYGPLSELVAIGQPVRVDMAGRTAFRGRVDDVDHDLEVATLALVDEVAALAAVSFVETSVPQEVSAARIKRILDLAGWDTARRDIASGGVLLQAGTVSADAWSELLEVARNELGAVWVTPAGVVTFRTRAGAWANTAPLAVLGCPPSDTYLTDLGLKADQSALVNVMSAARRGGTAATFSDPPSLTAYGPHTHVQQDLELASDGDRDLWAGFYLDRSHEPAKGVDRVAAQPGNSAANTLLGVPFGGTVQVKDQGHGPDIDQTNRWLGTRWVAQPAHLEVAAVLGQNQSIGPVARTRTLDTAAEWAAVQVTPAPTNALAAEPGIRVDRLPKRPAGM